MWQINLNAEAEVQVGSSLGDEVSILVAGIIRATVQQVTVCDAQISGFCVEAHLAWNRPA